MKTAALHITVKDRRFGKNSCPQNFRTSEHKLLFADAALASGALDLRDLTVL